VPVCCVCVCVLQSVYVCVCCGACLQVFQKLASKFHYTRAFTQMKPQRRLTSSVELPTAVLARSQSHHSTAQHSTAQHKSIHKNCYHTNPSPLQCSSSRRCYQCRRHTSTHTQTTTPFPHPLKAAAHGAVTNVGDTQAPTHKQPHHSLTSSMELLTALLPMLETHKHPHTNNHTIPSPPQWSCSRRCYQCWS